MTSAIAVISSLMLGASPPATHPIVPWVRVVDLAVGETAEVTLHDGHKVAVKLLEVKERRDNVVQAVQQALATVQIDARHTVTLTSGMYRLPVTVAGVQIDCPVTGGYRINNSGDHWGLLKDARLGLWPGGSPLTRPGTFVYPVRQRWFASGTWFSNEPIPRLGGKTYYHAGMDFGGLERMTEVVCATDGVVVSAGTQVHGDPKRHPPVMPRYDVVYVKDARGWYYRYSHLDAIATAVQPGTRVRAGQFIGLVGKEGASGGWAHLHFEIKSPQPSGQWGTQDSYGFLWEAYQREHHPKLLAVARPRCLLRPGETATLDASRSWAREGVTEYQWTFGDGSTVSGPIARRQYDRPGCYSEILRISDASGHVDYDFAQVRVVDEVDPPRIHAAYHPTFGLEPGDPVTFKARAFNAKQGQDRWDFGDGSPPVVTHSSPDPEEHAPDGYATTIHRFQKPGRYIVRVERKTPVGVAIDHLLVRVGIED